MSGNLLIYPGLQFKIEQGGYLGFDKDVCLLSSHKAKNSRYSLPIQHPSVFMIIQDACSFSESLTNKLFEL